MSAPINFNAIDMEALFGLMRMDSSADIRMMAKMAEGAERYEDMCQFMRYRVEAEAFKNTPLSTEERNLLSVAYKNVIGSRRSAWRTLSAELAESETEVTPVLKKYKEQIEKELEEISLNVLFLLEQYLIPASEEGGDTAVEEKVFYLKMAGDYYRYLTESVSDEDENYKNKTSEYYQKATVIANDLAPTHPIRLGLALNYSVCFYEILKQEQEACKLAKSAFDEAISKLDELSEADYKDSTLIMQLLRDNLTLWTSNGDEHDIEVENLDEQ